MTPTTIVVVIVISANAYFRTYRTVHTGVLPIGMRIVVQMGIQYVKTIGRGDGDMRARLLMRLI